MLLPKERRKNLVKIVRTAAEEDALTAEEAMAIIQICIDACERKKAELTEEILIDRFND